MNQFLEGLLWGCGGSLILVPIWISFSHLIKKTKERRKIKRLIAKNQILIPIDKRDFDVEKWGGIIDMTNKDEELKQLNMKIFKHE